MTDSDQITTTLLSLLDTAAAIIRLPPAARNVVGLNTIQFLLDNAKSLDRLLAGASTDLSTQPAPAATPAVIEVIRHIETPAPQSVKRPAKRPAPLPPTAEAASANPVVTQEGEDEPKSSRLPFAAFDTLVRSEMKRLSMEGRIPNAKLWDAERDSRLPTLAGVMMRYRRLNLADLATEMGMQPPLSAHRYTINENGAQAIAASQ